MRVEVRGDPKAIPEEHRSFIMQAVAGWQASLGPPDQCPSCTAAAATDFVNGRGGKLGRNGVREWEAVRSAGTAVPASGRQTRGGAGPMRGVAGVGPSSGLWSSVGGVVGGFRSESVPADGFRKMKSD